MIFLTLKLKAIFVYLVPAVPKEALVMYTLELVDTSPEQDLESIPIAERKKIGCVFISKVCLYIVVNSVPINLKSCYCVQQSQEGAWKLVVC